MTTATRPTTHVAKLSENRVAYRKALVAQNRSLRRPGVPSTDDLSIEVATEKALPPLAWLGIRKGRAYRFRLGPGVERFANGFFEGVWSGDFTRFAEVHRHMHFGSGVLIRKSVLFLPPKHVLEHIFILRDHADDTDYVSNSLCFCLAAGAPDVDPGSWQPVVEKTLEAAALGVLRYDATVLSHGRFSLYRVMHNNFHFTRSGNIRFVPRYPGMEFKGFHAYRAYLGRTIDALFANATHRNRKGCFEPIVSISRGYDSPAAAVLARDAGCRYAATIKGKVRGKEDSGREIGEALGLTVIEFDNIISNDIASLEMSYRGPLEEKAREFLATAGIGDDLTFLAFEPALRQRLLVTGVWGDSIWARDATVPPGLPTRTPFGKSLAEFRLRTGFAHVPVPMVGAFFPASIIAISNRPGMIRRYSVGGRYDRPIPRRIAEEAGIPRGMFGVAKNATSPDPTDRQELWRDAMIETMKRYLMPA